MTGRSRSAAAAAAPAAVERRGHFSGLTLVTGAAGFIGSFVAELLAARGDAVLGIDNLNDYYDPALKLARLQRLALRPSFAFERLDITDRAAVAQLFERHEVRRVVHLAAQAGVRYSLSNPHAYAETNVLGTLNLLEQARARPVEHFVYASTSSVYGANTQMPFATADRVDHPVSLYAATKRSAELMAWVYALQFGVAATGLRFFTVYGPWGRPDMALFKFTRAILAGEPIDVYNHGNMQRDFTYIDDVAAGVVRVLDRVPAPDLSTGRPVPHRVYNLGNQRPEPLLRYIEVLGQVLGQSPKMNLLPMQPGDVAATWADVEPLQRDYQWQPSTPIEQGVPRFVAWYRDHYGV